MQRHFQKELESLKTTLIKLGSHAEAAIDLAIQAIIERNTIIAAQVIEGDWRINALEMEIDNAIIDLLALQQPVASDLRLILAAQKINNDLERLGDHAVNLAQSVSVLSKTEGGASFLLIPKMSEIAKQMLRDSLDGFIHNTADLGRKVLERDDEIDALNKSMVQEVIGLLKRAELDLEAGIELIRVSRNLERVADLATNIAEEVIFVAQARIVKHHADDPATGNGTPHHTTD